MDEFIGNRPGARARIVHSQSWLLRLRRCALLGLLLLALCPLGMATADDAVQVVNGGDEAGATVKGAAQDVLSGEQLAPVDPTALPDPLDQPPVEPAGEAAVPFNPTPIDITTLSIPADREQLLKHLSEGYSQPYAEITLEDALAMALEHNHDLNSKRLSAAAACVGVKINWTALRPQLSLRGQAYQPHSNVSTKPISIPLPDGSSFTLNLGSTADEFTETLALNLTQTIYDFGLTNDLIDASKAQFAIQNYTVEMAEQQLLNSVTAAYLNFTLALGQLRIREDELRLADEILRQARVQYEVGTAPRLDVIRAEQRVQQSRDDLIAAQSALGDASALFFSYLGVEDQRYVPQLVTAPMLELGPEPPAVDAVIATALDQRPELELSYATLFAGEAGVKLTANRPILQAFATDMMQHPSSQFQGSNSSQVGVQLLWNVYTGGKDRLQRKQAKLQLAALTEGLMDLEAKIELDATTAWDRLMSARASTEAAQKALELSAEGLRAAAIGYGAGVTPYLDFATAMDQNVQAGIGYLVALVSVQVAAANLERAQGYPAGYPGQGADACEVGPDSSERELAIRSSTDSAPAAGTADETTDGAGS